jgi:MFS family permease
MLVRFGARQWIARSCSPGGLLSAGMMFVQSPLQFYVLRFLLGVAEAGFYPGVIYYFSGWFPPCHRGGRSAASMSPARSRPSSWAVFGLAAGARRCRPSAGWQWLFLVQGLPSVLVGLLVLRWLPDSPATVAWLTQPEKDWIQRELAREQAQHRRPVGHHVLAAFRNPRVLLLGAMGFLLIGAITTFILSHRHVLADATNLGARAVGYLVSLGGIIGAVAMLFAGDYADRRGDRFLNAFWCTWCWRARSSSLRFRRHPPSPWRLPGICRNLLHDPDADVVGMGGGSACARAGRRRRCNQYPVADRRIRHAVCMGRGEGRHGKLPRRAECALHNDAGARGTGLDAAPSGAGPAARCCDRCSRLTSVVADSLRGGRSGARARNAWHNRDHAVVSTLPGSNEQQFRERP